ncbi:2-hydroxyacyl-CoA dehydratase subunit D [Calderihabitans maritimus]|uniref:Benzoyl-CoA reductase, gamma subunit n=1 Tax=Calderihabitans maritimus TaxID=1246530 RepID=A0A1Z5HWL6_9FIRM|nr:2-hydroxyacyl-CoA dehydratase family protein [Calderihabitans maritimus]GAW93808.1 benzoyl-CoA reductase, gamma subunit [Calderihabitans maritimus]
MRKNLDAICDHPEEVARKYKDQGRSVMGYLCTYTPEETLYAAGFIPVRLRGHTETISLGNDYLPSYTCSYIRSVLDQGLAGKWNCLAGFVAPHTCDTVFNSFQVWQRNVPTPYTYLIRFPHVSGPAALEFLIEEFKNIIHSLEVFTGREITNEQLNEAIEVYNEKRRLLKEVDLARSENPPRLRSTEAMQLTLASMYLDVVEANQLLRQYLEDNGNNTNNFQRKRLHLSGSCLVDHRWVTLIEECGGQVVSDDLCTGSRYYWQEVKTGKNPLEALAERYINKIPCFCVHPTQRRFDLIKKLVLERQVEGVVILLQKFCDTYLFEYPAIKEMLDELGVSSLFIEVEQGMSSTGQVKTRIEAFIESLK